MADPRFHSAEDATSGREADSPPTENADERPWQASLQGPMGPPSVLHKPPPTRPAISMANLQPVRRPPDDVPSAATTFVSSPRTPKSSHDYLPAAPPLPRLQPTTDAQPDQTKATEPELSDQTNLLPLRQVAVVFMGLVRIGSLATAPSGKI